MKLKIKEKINWGIIGLGNIAEIFTKSFKNLENAKLIAVASKNKHKLKKYSEKFNIKKEYCFNNYNEILACKEIDAIYIALPNSLHAEWIKNGLLSNMNILCEKPITTSYSELKKIHNILHQKKELLLVEGFMYLHHPIYNKILSLIKENAIGKINQISASFGNKIIKKYFFDLFGRYKINKEHRLYNKNLGGGAILDIGCYPASFLVFFSKIVFNKKNNIFKIKEKNNKYCNEVDIDSYIKMELPTEIKVNLSCSFIKNLSNKIEILGDKGNIKIFDPWHVRENKFYLNDKEHFVGSEYSDVYSLQISKISEIILSHKNRKIKKILPYNINNSLTLANLLDQWRCND